MPMLAGSRHKRIQWTFTVHFNFKFTTRKRLLLLRMGMWQKLFIINYLDINIIHYSLSTHLSLNRDCGYHCNVCIFVGWECPRSATISVHCPGSSRHQSSLNINTEDGDEGGWSHGHCSHSSPSYTEMIIQSSAAITCSAALRSRNV